MRCDNNACYIRISIIYHLCVYIFVDAASKGTGRNIVLVEGVRTPFLMSGTRQVWSHISYPDFLIQIRKPVSNSQTGLSHALIQLKSKCWIKFHFQNRLLKERMESSFPILYSLVCFWHECNFV